MILSSNRKFGVEIEGGISDGTSSAIAQAIRGLASVGPDSSITLPNGAEFITKPLRGSQGEDTIKLLSKALCDNKVETDNNSCGLHIHLDVPEFLNKQRTVVISEGGEGGFLSSKGHAVASLWEVPKEIISSVYKNPSVRDGIDFITGLREPENNNFGKLNAYGFSTVYYKKEEPEVKTTTGKKVVFPKYILGTVDRFDSNISLAFHEWRMDKIQKGELTGITKEESKQMYEKEKKLLFKSGDSRTFAKIEVEENFLRVKTLLHFFILFDSMFQAMVPKSRTEDNAYCMPISDFFTLNQVRALNNYFEFEKLWYKETEPAAIERQKNLHYSDSRYLDYNFHSLFNRTKTVEVRLHPSTKDANQILLWLSLHQHIVDTISKLDVNGDDFDSLVSIDSSIEDKVQAFETIFELPKHLRQYVRRMIKHYSELNIN